MGPVPVLKDQPSPFLSTVPDRGLTSHVNISHPVKAVAVFVSSDQLEKLSLGGQFRSQPPHAPGQLHLSDADCPRFLAAKAGYAWFMGAVSSRPSASEKPNMKRLTVGEGAVLMEIEVLPVVAPSGLSDVSAGLISDDSAEIVTFLKECKLTRSRGICEGGLGRGWAESSLSSWKDEMDMDFTSTQGDAVVRGSRPKHARPSENTQAPENTQQDARRRKKPPQMPYPTTIAYAAARTRLAFWESSVAWCERGIVSAPSLWTTAFTADRPTDSEIGVRLSMERF
ncbi:hypothetical protein BDK51DRAFT_39757 [Blyttiomyces helicus]|uniref:Uncharacterized protein n=1 Tax=Blyttiomyces helicus TaxID=388810 RepID=A0A4P9WAC7_9FUNG|nr:hypothetical protein BDK51DRAFT_39757 [Blyttiomyces helicus]|eukprot:RKO89384.1 hypothetical protein BDK51DRAFT_39757 [Blyttiomyces helicus]